VDPSTPTAPPTFSDIYYTETSCCHRMDRTIHPSASVPKAHTNQLYFFDRTTQNNIKPTIKNVKISKMSV